MNSQTLYKILADAMPNADLKIEGGEGKYSVSMLSLIHI